MSTACLFFNSCEVLVQFCEIQGKFYGNVNELSGAEEEQNCCDVLFNTTPMFDYAGTCYTTNQPVVEFTASMFSSITIWLNAMRVERQISIDTTQWVNDYTLQIRLTLPPHFTTKSIREIQKL